MPTDELTTLLQRVDEQTAQHSRLVAAYGGRSPISYLAPEVRAALNNRLATVAVNIPRLLIDTLAERLRIIGFTDERVWPDWLANDLDVMAGIAHREAMMLGTCYAIVWARPDGRPKVSIESATQMAVRTDPATREVLSAVKRWETREGTHAVLYKPETIVHYVSPTMGATTGFRAVQTVSNPFGIPPVVRFRNGDRLVDTGISEMLDVLPLTDALTKLTIDKSAFRAKCLEVGLTQQETAQLVEWLEKAQQGRRLVPQASYRDYRFPHDPDPDPLGKPSRKWLADEE